ncbi:zona pellucida sperm-binding protein 4-like [Lepisosteus oculatus]|uniref:zona pellucida sperm-binding protein 4-like n=1 Tax=Lepisosteus oculatus TaxID=7918 RepID=UPI003722F14F
MEVLNFHSGSLVSLFFALCVFLEEILGYPGVSTSAASPDDRVKGRQQRTAAELCSVRPADALACGEPQVGEARCRAKQCCFDSSVNPSCFYKNDVTVECTSDGYAVVAVSKAVTQPPLRLESLRLNEDTAAPCSSPASRTPGFVLFRFPLSSCGTTTKEIDNMLVYENQMSVSSRTAVITMDVDFHLTIRCSYPANKSLSVKAEVQSPTLPPSLTAYGPLHLELRIAKDESYSSYHPSSEDLVTLELQQPVPVEVRMVGRTDPNIHLILDDCWATATPSPFSNPHWNLLIDGCPPNEDLNSTKLIPVAVSQELRYPGHYKRFQTKMFAFLDPAENKALNDLIYFHCTATACQPSDLVQCNVSCSPGAEKSLNLSNMTLLLVNGGPVHLHAALN